MTEEKRRGVTDKKENVSIVKKIDELKFEFIYFFWLEVEFNSDSTNDF